LILQLCFVNFSAQTANFLKLKVLSYQQKVLHNECSNLGSILSTFFASSSLNLKFFFQSLKNCNLEAEYRQEANQIMLEHKAEVENLEKTFEEKLLSVQVSKDHNLLGIRF